MVFSDESSSFCPGKRELNRRPQRGRRPLIEPDGMSDDAVPVGGKLFAAKLNRPDDALRLRRADECWKRTLCAPVGVSLFLELSVRRSLDGSGIRSGRCAACGRRWVSAFFPLRYLVELDDRKEKFLRLTFTNRFSSIAFSLPATDFLRVPDRSRCRPTDGTGTGV